MTHVLVTPERAAIIKKLFAEREAAKADFAATCDKFATQPRSSFGSFSLSFEEIGLDLRGQRISRAVDWEPRPDDGLVRGHTRMDEQSVMFYICSIKPPWRGDATPRQFIRL